VRRPASGSYSFSLAGTSMYLDSADQLDERTQAAGVLGLRGQMQKPARQYPADQPEELPVEGDPHRRLSDSEGDQGRHRKRAPVSTAGQGPGTRQRKRTLTRQRKRTLQPQGLPERPSS